VEGIESVKRLFVVRELVVAVELTVALGVRRKMILWTFLNPPRDPIVSLFNHACVCVDNITKTNDLKF
jgi:hypothetical protein